ncbi:MAG: hypothetical protein NUV75_00665 [Gallionella sp.]|nr:hypothetical protein [Gallionella sp.]
MTDWKLAMIVVLPFLSGEGKLRAWAALLGASLAAMVLHEPFEWFIIDAIAAAIVMRPLAKVPQKAIGICFIGMMFYSLGFIIGGEGDPYLYRMVLTGIGWIQWAILAGWVGHDIFEPFVSRWRAGRDKVVIEGRFP